MTQKDQHEKLDDTPWDIVNDFIDHISTFTHLHIIYI
jgi:hypothetical protein